MGCLPTRRKRCRRGCGWLVFGYIIKWDVDKVGGRSYLRCIPHCLLIWHTSSVEHSLSTGEVMFACQHGRIAVEHWLAVLVVGLIAADEFEEARLLKTTSRLLGSGGFGHGGLRCVGIGWHGECDWSWGCCRLI
jgi:hypothetical protein